MWLRRAKHRDEAPTPEPDETAASAEERSVAGAGWGEEWSHREKDRVARWLGLKGDEAPQVEPPDVEDDREHQDLDEALIGVSEAEQDALETAPDVLMAEEVALEDQRRQLQETLAAARGELAVLEQHKARLAGELEAEQSSVQDERRRLAAAFESEKREVERVHAQWAETKARLEAEISGLQDQRARLVESMEFAESAAERARSAEREAVAGLEAARKQATRLEAEQFAVWEALDAEIKELEERRQQLRDIGDS